MYNFSYQRPASLSDAVRMLSDDDEAMPLAGGMTLIPSMKHRLAAPSQLLDLSGLPELRGITVSDEALTIGAVTPHAVVAADADVMAKLPALASLAGEIGSKNAEGSAVCIMIGKPKLPQVSQIGFHGNLGPYYC